MSGVELAFAASLLVAFPGTPLAATTEELEQLAGFWPDIEKSRAEARRLLNEAGAEGLKPSFAISCDPKVQAEFERGVIRERT